MPRSSTVRYAYQDYLTIPEDSSRRHEIVDGELIVSAVPRFRHQEVVSNLVELLRSRVRESELGALVAGPVTVHLRDDLVVEPDLVFVRRERLSIIDRAGDTEPRVPTGSITWKVGEEEREIPLEEVFRRVG